MRFHSRHAAGRCCPSRADARPALPSKQSDYHTTAGGVDGPLRDDSGHSTCKPAQARACGSRQRPGLHRVPRFKRSRPMMGRCGSPSPGAGWRTGWMPRGAQMAGLLLLWRDRGVSLRAATSRTSLRSGAAHVCFRRLTRMCNLSGAGAGARLGKSWINSASCGK